MKSQYFRFQAEALASAQAQQAAEELTRAQDEIDGLERALADKDKALRDEMQQSGRASQAVGKKTGLKVHFAIIVELKISKS